MILLKKVFFFCLPVFSTYVCVGVRAWALACVCVGLYVCVKDGEWAWLSDCLSVTTDTCSLLEGKHSDISAWPYSCPARHSLFSRLAPLRTATFVCACVCGRACERKRKSEGISQTKQDNVWPYGQWFWDLFHPQVTVKLSERQVCSHPRCTSPCLYLQLFSPLSVNILLTLAAQRDGWTGK